MNRYENANYAPVFVVACQPSAAQPTAPAAARRHLAQPSARRRRAGSAPGLFGDAVVVLLDQPVSSCRPLGPTPSMPDLIRARLPPPPPAKQVDVRAHRGERISRRVDAIDARDGVEDDRLAWRARVSLAASGKGGAPETSPCQVQAKQDGEHDFGDDWRFHLSRAEQTTSKAPLFACESRLGDRRADALMHENIAFPP
jgi:hypothetical protein